MDIWQRISVLKQQLKLENDPKIRASLENQIKRLTHEAMSRN